MTPLVGWHHTEKAKQKIGQAALGNRYCLGKRNNRNWVPTDEQRVKMREGALGNKRRLGYKASVETRTKISQAKRGKPGYPLSSEHREKLRQANIGNKHCLGRKLSDETRAKIGLANSIRPRTEAEKEFLRHLNTNPVFTAETRRKISEAGKGRIKSPEARAKLSQSLTGKKHSLETLLKIGAIKKRSWQDPEWRDKVILSQVTGRKEAMKRDPTWRARQIEAQRKGYSLFPNKAESALLALLEQDYPGEWAYVGNGSLIVGNWNPDFANINGQKELIEMFGDHWHRGQNPQDRIELFNEFGFRTLVVWECELKEPNKVRERIAKFTRSGASIKVGD